MAAQSSRGALGLLKRGWNEIPEVLGSTFMGMIGIGMGITACVIYQKKNGDVRRNKLFYTVVRPDDPRAKTAKLEPYNY